MSNTMIVEPGKVLSAPMSSLSFSTILGQRCSLIAFLHKCLGNSRSDLHSASFTKLQTEQTLCSHRLSSYIANRDHYLIRCAVNWGSTKESQVPLPATRSVGHKAGSWCSEQVFKVMLDVGLQCGLLMCI